MQQLGAYPLPVPLVLPELSDAETPQSTPPLPSLHLLPLPPPMGDAHASAPTLSGLHLLSPARNDLRTPAMRLLAATASLPPPQLPKPPQPGPARTFWSVVMNSDEPVPPSASVSAPPLTSAAAVVPPSTTTRGSKRRRLAATPTSSARPWKCELCDSAFALKGHLSQHIKYVHQKLRPHACPRPGCTAAFGTQFARNQHVWTVHDGRKPFVCHCGARFGQRSHLNRHTKRCDK